MLTLNGNPFEIPGDASKLRKTHIFILPKNAVSINDDPKENSRPAEMPPRHIPSHYYYREGGRRDGAQMLLRYFESKQPMHGVPGEFLYEPMFIKLYHGALKLTDKEQLVFFLKNHQNNEAVVTDPEHPSFVPRSEVIFRLYDPNKQADAKEEQWKTIEIIGSLIWGRNRISETEVQALVDAINGTLGMPKIFNVDELPDKLLRGKIMDIANVFPDKMFALMESDRTAYHEMLKELEIHQIIKWDDAENSWAELEPNGNKVPFLHVETAQDRVKVIVDWMDERGTLDVNMKRFQSRLKRAKEKTE